MSDRSQREPEERRAKEQSVRGTKGREEGIVQRKEEERRYTKCFEEILLK